MILLTDDIKQFTLNNFFSIKNIEWANIIDIKIEMNTQINNYVKLCFLSTENQLYYSPLNFFERPYANIDLRIFMRNDIKDEHGEYILLFYVNKTELANLIRNNRIYRQFSYEQIMNDITYLFFDLTVLYASKETKTFINNQDLDYNSWHEHHEFTTNEYLRLLFQDQTLIMNKVYVQLGRFIDSFVTDKKTLSQNISFLPLNIQEQLLNLFNQFFVYFNSFRR